MLSGLSLREAGMIRTGEEYHAGTGEEYRAGLRDGREIWIDGERVADVTAHPAFKPIVELRRACTTSRTIRRRRLGRVPLPPYPCRFLYPGHAASLFGLPGKCCAFSIRPT